MSLHAVVQDTQIGVLHVVSAGLTATSVAGALGYVPTIIACGAGVMAMASYAFAIADSVAFQRLFGPKSSPPTKPLPVVVVSGPTGTH